MLKLIGIFSAA